MCSRAPLSPAWSARARPTSCSSPASMSRHGSLPTLPLAADHEPAHPCHPHVARCHDVPYRTALAPSSPFLCITGISDAIATADNPSALAPPRRLSIFRAFRPPTTLPHIMSGFHPFKGRVSRHFGENVGVRIPSPASAFSYRSFTCPVLRLRLRAPTARFFLRRPNCWRTSSGQPARAVGEEQLCVLAHPASCTFPPLLPETRLTWILPLRSSRPTMRT